MPEYLRPGVYIEEIERGPRPIEGVPTSTAAFLGAAERGSIKPRLVTSYKDYQRYFGNVFGLNNFLPYAVSGFFENGGQRAYICRLVDDTATIASMAAGANFTVQAAGSGGWGKRVIVSIQNSTTRKADGTPVGFQINAAYFAEGAVVFNPFVPGAPPRIPPPQLTETFDDLVADESSPDYFGKRINFIDLAKGTTNQGPESSSLITLVRASGAPASAEPDRIEGLLPDNGAEATVPLGVDDYVGRPTTSRTESQGLDALEFDPYRDVSLVYAPAVDKPTAKKIVEHCEKLKFRFAVIDSQKGETNPGEVDPRTARSPDPDLESSYGAYYYPWLMTNDPVTGARKLVPPGGHVLGIYARTDVERGVFKAPANENVRGAIDLQIEITDGQQQQLNPRGVNAIRRFPGRGIRVWGARTLTSNALWKYVSVRRLFIFLERSIFEGTQWVVFEPNDPRLWARVTDTVRLFLRNQWREGALFGRREEDAFFVNCNLGTTMSMEDILNGRLVCEIGIAPVRPAEFVVFRIFQNTAEAQR